MMQLCPIWPVSSNWFLCHIITASLWSSPILGFVLEVVFLMFHLPLQIVGLLHIHVVPSYVVRVIFFFVDCVETCVVPLVYTLAWISRQPVFGNTTCFWFSSSDCFPSPLTLDNALGWSVFPTYLNPKSSTTNENVIGIHLCLHMHSLLLNGVYPFSYSRHTSCWLARITSCVRPYITFQISHYTYPLCARFMRLYSSMISSGSI